MPRYVIERQFLVPMFEHVFIEAPDLITACRRAIDDSAEPWGDYSGLDFDNSRAVTVTEAVEIPDGMYPELRSREDGDRHTLSDVLYVSGLEHLSIPEEVGEGDDPTDERMGFV